MISPPNCEAADKTHHEITITPTTRKKAKHVMWLYVYLSSPASSLMSWAGTYQNDCRHESHQKDCSTFEIVVKYTRNICQNLEDILRHRFVTFFLKQIVYFEIYWGLKFRLKLELVTSFWMFVFFRTILIFTADDFWLLLPLLILCASQPTLWVQLWGERH